MKICISSGHGKHVRGASGYIDEVDEARKVVNKVAEILRTMGVGVETFHDDVSKSQSENLDRIVDWHNTKTRDYDISVHFNAYQTTSKPMGVEVLYVTQATLADKVSAAIAKAGGFLDRGPKKRTDLAFLNGTEAKSLLLETCFVDSKADVDLYKKNFEAICKSIAQSISGQTEQPPATIETDLPPVFDQPTIDAICTIAANSKIAGYAWKDRGKAPLGYIQGMALTFGMVIKRFEANDPAAIEMAAANSWDEDTDAFAHYQTQFEALGMSNEKAGMDCLRHLFVLMLGLGMRELSGKYCEGKDQSASNTQSETCEAGLFQTSWNMHTAHEQIDRLFEQYAPALAGNLPQCYINTFEKGVDCSDTSWKCYGSGDGYDHQLLSKNCPPYHIEMTAIGLRNRRQHWGPINERKAELRADSNIMFQAIQDFIRTPTTAPITPEVSITITIKGAVKVTVDGQEI